jgi:SulP family sulfate permease
VTVAATVGGAARPLLPRAADYRGWRRSWSQDLAAGVTVGIVALPLALGFAVATGVGASVGLVTAVVAGAVAAVFGGSHLQVSGPTGAMTVVLVPLVASHGPQVVYPVAVLAGLVVVGAALLRLGRLLAYVPWPLVEGFTVGIAVVIAAQQVPNALGVPRPSVQNAAAAAVVSVGRFVQDPQWAVLALLAVAVLLTAYLPRLHRSLPSSLIAVVAVTLLAQVTGADVTRIGALPSSLPVPSVPDLGSLPTLVGPALVVAFLAALESLMSARAADGMSDAPRHDPDRELLGQGLANVASGLCGGMPATGAIARTAVNARAGAHTRLAALTHAVVLAGIVLAASGLVSRIPLVALAGVLVVTAYRMVERHNVVSVLRSTRGDAFVFGLTAVATVALDLIRAVELGLAAAVLLAVAHLARTAQAVPEPLESDGVTGDAEHELLAAHVLTYRVDGPLFFGASARFLRELTATTDVQVVILRLSTLALLDATGDRRPRARRDRRRARGPRHHGPAQGRQPRAHPAAHGRRDAGPGPRPRARLRRPAVSGRARPPARAALRPGCADVVAAEGGLDLHDVAGVRGADHLAVADVDADVVDRAAEEHQVAGLHVRAADVRAAVVLRGCGVRQRDARVAPGPHGQAGAVERARAGRAPLVGLAELVVRLLHRHARPAAGRTVVRGGAGGRGGGALGRGAAGGAGHGVAGVGERGRASGLGRGEQPAAGGARLGGGDRAGAGLRGLEAGPLLGLQGAEQRLLLAEGALDLRLLGSHPGGDGAGAGLLLRGRGPGAVEAVPGGGGSGHLRVLAGRDAVERGGPVQERLGGAGADELHELVGAAGAVGGRGDRAHRRADRVERGLRGPDPGLRDRGGPGGGREVELAAGVLLDDHVDLGVERVDPLLDLLQGRAGVGAAGRGREDGEGRGAHEGGGEKAVAGAGRHGGGSPLPSTAYRVS